MVRDITTPSDLRFPPYRLDVANACLWRRARAVRLTPKAFAVLRCLAEHPGELFTKEALLEAVWPGIAVSDAVLKVCVGEIRKALGDPVGAPRYIATVHGRGYRFVAEVSDSDPRPERDLVGPRRAATDLAAARVPQYRTPAHFVGRAAAVDALQRALDAAWRGTRQVVFVTGEPGIGKTGVVDAFLERTGADSRVWIAHGQCVETYGTGEPYLPVLSALSRLCRGAAGDWLVAFLRRRAPTWLVQMPWLLDVADRDALQRELLGATRERMLREMAEAVEALTADAPLVLVLEDLHWSDTATLDLLSLLARRHEPARLLLIGTARPVEAMAEPPPLSDIKRALQAQARCQELALDLLGEVAVGDYLRARFPDSAFPAELATVVHHHTEGNPLFMVSVIDDLVAHGTIAARDRRWELHAALDDIDLSVPENLRQMIERQISGLSHDEQRVLEAGSVGGVDFSAAAVAAALGMKPLDVEEWCDRLAQQQLFLRPLGTRAWPDRTMTARYEFTHALYRHTLYQRIPPMRRHELHRTIGERVEVGWGDRAREIAARLAMHFEQAGDDRRGLRYLELAAETATRRHANREAIGYLQRAIQVATHLPEPERVATRLALLEQLGLAHRSTADVTAAVDDFAALAAYAREQGRAAEEARALLYLASVVSWLDRDKGLLAVEQALALVYRLDDAVLRAHVRGYSGVQRILARGWRDEDAEACREAIAAARSAHDTALLSLHVGHYAYLQSHRSEYRAASRTAEEGLSLALEARDAYHYMACQFHRAWALLHLGEWGAAQGILRDGLQMAERNSHHLWARAFRYQTAWLFTEAGAFDRARALCQQAREPEHPAQLGQLLGSIVLGRANLGLRRYTAALRALEEVAVRCAKGPIQMDWILQMPLRLGLFEYWFARRAYRRAREQAEELCRIAETSGERTYLALGRGALAECGLAERDPGTASREVAEALRTLDGCEAPLAEWRVYATAARCEEARGQREQAGAYWARSAAVLDRLTASLDNDGDLRRSFGSHPAVLAIRRRMRLNDRPSRPSPRATAKQKTRNPRPTR